MRRVIIGVMLVGLSVAGLALYWFQPWKLFVDQTVEEALPTVPAESPAAGAAEEGATLPAAGAADASEPRFVSRGPFRDLEHETTGTAAILELSDGSRFVRLEDLRTSNGPDLIVLLSDTPATEDSWGAYDDGSFVSLGELRGNIGSQNYEIPSSVDLSRYRSVVIWCRRFTVGFGAAPIR